MRLSSSPKPVQHEIESGPGKRQLIQHSRIDLVFMFDVLIEGGALAVPEAIAETSQACREENAERTVESRRESVDPRYSAYPIARSRSRVSGSRSSSRSVVPVMNSRFRSAR